MSILPLVLIGISVSFSNFAGAVSIGLSGVDARTRLRVGLAFGLFESAMPILGLLLGRELSETLGALARYVGGALLVGAGLWTVREALKGREEQEQLGGLSWNRLLLTAMALSLDNLVAGFALGIYTSSILVAAAVFAVVGVSMSLVGLELGNRLGARIESQSELLGGAILVVIGAALGLGLLR